MEPVVPVSVTPRQRVHDHVQGSVQLQGPLHVVGTPTRKWEGGRPEEARPGGRHIPPVPLQIRHLANGVRPYTLATRRRLARGQRCAFFGASPHSLTEDVQWSRFSRTHKKCDCHCPRRRTTAHRIHHTSGREPRHDPSLFAHIARVAGAHLTAVRCLLSAIEGEAHYKTQRATKA